MNVETIKTSVGYLLSGALVAMGTRAILDPLGHSKAYGIPIENLTGSYVPPVGFRNISTGVSIGALLLQGQKRAAGTVLSTALLVGVLDTWYTYTYAGQWTSGALSHVVGDGLAGIVGLWLMA